MPTENPRIQVTLDPEFRDVIRRIGVSQGLSQSGVISWVLSAQRQALTQLAEVLDLEREVSGKISTPLQVELIRMETDATAAAAQAQEQLDLAKALLEEERDRQAVVAKGSPDPLRDEPRPVLSLASRLSRVVSKP